jgi:hypothetical protein
MSCTSCEYIGEVYHNGVWQPACDCVGTDEAGCQLQVESFAKSIGVTGYRVRRACGQGCTCKGTTPTDIDAEEPKHHAPGQLRDLLMAHIGEAINASDWMVANHVDEDAEMEAHTHMQTLSDSLQEMMTTLSVHSKPVQTLRTAPLLQRLVNIQQLGFALQRKLGVR